MTRKWTPCLAAVALILIFAFSLKETRRGWSRRTAYFQPSDLDNSIQN